MPDDLNPRRDESESFSSSTVLLLAEDPSDCALLGTLFLKHLGCQMRGATSLGSAMEILSSVDVAVVVLVARRREEGIRHLRKLRRPDRNHRLRVMVVALGDGAGNPVDFLLEGADDAVIFPCPGAELLARVRRLLTQTREPQGRVTSRRYSLAGDLSSLSLTELIGLFDYAAATGCLGVFTRRGTARLIYRLGQMTHAVFGHLEGREALFELLREREAQFEFVPGDWFAEEEHGALEGSTAALLLEGTQAIDERPSQGTITDRMDPGGEPETLPAGTVTPALTPDLGIAEEWIHEVTESSAWGEIRLLSRSQVHAWTAADPAGLRFRMVLITDIACGVQTLSALAAPLVPEEIARVFRQPPNALGFTLTGRSGQTLEILLLDSERLVRVVDGVMGAPAVMILAPSYGDFLTLDMAARDVLRQFIQQAPPLAILAVGNEAIENHVQDFLSLARLSIPVRFVPGSLWKLDPAPRTLLVEAIGLWASLASTPRSEAA